MRSIDITSDEREGLKALVSNAPERGYTLEQMRRGVKILDRLDSESPLVLEEAEWAFLVDRIQNTQWRVATALVLAMVDKVLDAQETKPGA